MKKPYLNELRGLSERLRTLEKQLGNDAVSRVERRMIQGARQDVNRLIEQHRPPRSVKELQTALSKLEEHPKSPETHRPYLHQLNAMIDECNQAILRLYRKHASGEISQKQLQEMLHGDNGYDRLRLRLIHQKDAALRANLQRETQERMDQSIINQLDNSRAE